MIELVYASAARHPFSHQDLGELLRRARANNAMRGLTGVLLYDRGSFLQALEGPEHEIERLFETLRRDPRHHRLTRIHEGKIASRRFGEWTMGFVHLEKPGIAKGLNAFMQGASLASITGQAPGATSDAKGDAKGETAVDPRANAFLHAFREGRFRTYVDAAG